MLVKSNEQGQNPFVGGKSKRIHDLMMLGLNVPSFVVVPADVVVVLVDQKGEINTEMLQQVRDEVLSQLSCTAYAVRSNALIEDTKMNSLAGQFKTKLNVKKDGLSVAITEVVLHAYDYLHKNLQGFSLLIQEFIEPEIAGVTFTRSPLGGREMVVEYSKGRGETLVSGKNKPKNVRFNWNQVKKITAIPQSDLFIAQIKKIEQYFAFPQDIEWAVKGKHVYFLQTRPISTLSKKTYKEQLYLDSTLKDLNDFKYEKTEISEIAPRPVPLTLDLLRKLYAQDGPIAHVYASHHVMYSDTDFLKIVGNELYVDREAELKSLMPAQSLLQGTNFQAVFVQFRGLLKTFKNMSALRSITHDDFQDLFDVLQVKLEVESSDNTIETWIKNFLKDYELIFAINLYAGLELNRLKFAIRDVTSLPMATVLASGLGVAPLQHISFEELGLQGNSLDIADETPFQRVEQMSSDDSTFLNDVPRDKIKHLTGHITKTRVALALRERGRWLVVRRINALRALLLKKAAAKGFKTIRNIYFSSFAEINTDTVHEKDCIKRRNVYERFNAFNLPAVLTNKLEGQAIKQLQGVSPGIATGVLKRVDDLDSNSESVIVYTTILSPNLVVYFDRVVGIISENGGELSHLAIMAREKGIPVVTGIAPGQFVLDSMITIDGTSGSITYASKKTRS